MLKSLRVAHITSCVVLGAFVACQVQAKTGYAYPEAASVVKAVVRFSGSATGDYYVPNGSIKHQILLGLTVPDQVRHLDNGATLTSGCRWQSCSEKAAIVQDQSGRLLAAGIISFKCHRSGLARVSCNKAPTLSIFRRSRLRNAKIESWLMDWGHKISPGSPIEHVVLG